MCIKPWACINSMPCCQRRLKPGNAKIRDYSTGLQGMIMRKVNITRASCLPFARNIDCANIRVRLWGRAARTNQVGRERAVVLLPSLRKGVMPQWGCWPPTLPTTFHQLTMQLARSTKLLRKILLFTLQKSVILNSAPQIDWMTSRYPASVF